MKWIILSLLVVLSVACSNESLELQQMSGASLKCKIEGSQLKSELKSSYAKRGSAPVYISGVILTANNTEYDVDDVVSEYTFNPEGQSSSDKDIILQGLTVGSNTVSAVGVCNNSAKNKYYMDVDRADGDLSERANSYSSKLKTLQPIFASYTSLNPVEVNISNGNSNSISIPMVTNNHRVVVVLENSNESKYNLSWEVLESDNTNPLVSSSQAGELPVGTQDAIVINSESAKGSKRYTVRVTYSTINSGVEVGTITKTIDANAYDDITKLYHFSKRDLLEAEAEISFMTWTPMRDDNSGETIK